MYACLSVSMCVCVCVVRKMETQPKELSVIVVVAGSPGKKFVQPTHLTHTPRINERTHTHTGAFIQFKRN